MLRYVVVFLMAGAFCSSKPISEDVIEEMAKLNEECKETTGLGADEFHKALLSDTKDEKVKDHALCIGEKMDTIDSDGKINEDNFKKHFKEAVPEIADEVIEKCMVEEDTAKETAYNVSKCVVKIFENKKET